MSLVPLPLIAVRQQAALAALLIGLICALAAGAAGFVLGKRLGVAHSERVLAEYRAAVIDHAAVNDARHEAQKDVLIQRGMQLGTQLVTEREQHALEAAELKRSIARVKQSQRPISATKQTVAAGHDECLLSVDFVGLYNAAIGAGEPPAVPGAASAAGADTQATTTEATDSGVRPDDVLYHITDYGHRCRDIESQLNGLIHLREPANGRD